MACWISLDKNTASKDSTVRLTYDRNTTGEKRTATVEVKSPDGAIVKRYTIVQNEQILEGNDLRTKECTRNCGDGGVSATQMVTVEANTFMAETKEQANALADEELKKKCESVSPTLTCTWTNDEITRPVQKNDCLVTEEGSFVDWTVEAGEYSSTVSKADANAKAEAEFGPEGKGQENANLHGTCTTTLWYSKEMRDSFPVTKCEENFTPVPAEVEYVVPAGKYSWTDTMPPVDGLTGQEAADKQAQNDLEANGPANANLPENSTCEENDFFLGKYSFTYTRDDCAEHFHSPELFVDQTNTEVPGYPWKSYISQKDADDMAKAAIDEYGNAKIMEMDCIEDQKWIGQFNKPFTKTCPDNGSGSSHVIDATMVEGYPESVTSYESEDVANGLAEAAVLAQGQALADAISSGTCTWVGAFEKQFQRDNCEEGFVGSFIKVNATMTTGYPENSTSTVSKADADTKARTAVEAQGQGIANTQGTCEEGVVYYGVATQELTRADCPTCQKGTKMTVTSDDVFGVNKFPSLESQPAADALALTAMNEPSEIEGVTKAQAWVNKNGDCDDDPALTNNPVWTDSSEMRCLDGRSQKKQINSNTCYTGPSQEQWIDGGDKVCQWTGEASLPFTPACNSSYQGTDHKGTASGTITITQNDVTGDFTSIISPEDADAKALAAVTAQGQAIADQRGIASGMCTWTAVYSKTYTRDNCGSCKVPSAACTNQTVTSTQVNSNNPVSSTVSYEDAHNKAVTTLTAQTEGKEAGQAYINKNCGDCDNDDLTANWVLDSSTYVCNGCSSARLYRDTNECSGSYNTTKYVNEGSKDCSTNGTWSNTSSTRCNGCTSEVQQSNSCGGTRWTTGGSRNCDDEGGVSRYSYSCTGCTRYRTTHYGCGGTYTETWAYNSADCGTSIRQTGCDGIASTYWYENSCSGDITSGPTVSDRCGCKENYSNDCTATGSVLSCEEDSNGYRTGYGYLDYKSTSECFDCSSYERQLVRTDECGCGMPICEGDYSCINGVSQRSCIDMCGNETFITGGTACCAELNCSTVNGESCGGTDCSCTYTGCSGTKKVCAGTMSDAVLQVASQCDATCSKIYTHNRSTSVSNAKCAEVCPSGSGTSKGVNVSTTGTGASCSEAGTQSWNRYLSEVSSNYSQYCNCGSSTGTLSLGLRNTGDVFSYYKATITMNVSGPTSKLITETLEINKRVNITLPAGSYTVVINPQGTNCACGSDGHIFTCYTGFYNSQSSFIIFNNQTTSFDVAMRCS